MNVSSCTGLCINTKRRAVDIIRSNKTPVANERWFQSFTLTTVPSETDVTGQQPITIEEGTRSRAACCAAIWIVLAVFVVRVGFRDRLRWRLGHWALQTICLMSLP